MLEDLDSVDWAEVECIDGSAREVPLILEALASSHPLTSARALEVANLQLLHQEGLSPAAVAVLPFLMEIAGTPGVHQRGALLRLVFDIARDRNLVRWGFGPAPDEVMGQPSALAMQATSVMREQGHRASGWLSDGDPTVRAYAALLVAFCLEPGAASREALARARTAEPDTLVRAGLLLASGLASRDSGSPSPLPLEATDDALTAGCVAAARVLAGARSTERDRAALEELARVSSVDADRFPWCEGEPAAVCAFALAALARRGETDAAGSLRRALVCFANAGMVPGGYPWQSLTECALRATFAGCFGKEKERAFQDLDAAQQGLMRELVSRGWYDMLESHAHQLLGELGLMWGRDAARAVGLAPAGPLDEPLVIGGEQRPTWIWLRRVARTATPSEVVRFDNVRDAIEQRSPADILALALDAAAGHYALPGQSTVLGPGGLERLLDLVEPVRARLTAEIARRAAGPIPEKPTEAALVAALLVRCGLLDGVALDEPQLTLLERGLPISREVGDELLRALPVAVRERLVLRLRGGVLWAREYMRACPTPAVARRSVEALAEGAYAAPGRVLAVLGEMRDLGVATWIEEALRRPETRNRAVLEQALRSLRPTN